jgi:hypothetical protein
LSGGTDSTHWMTRVTGMECEKLGLVPVIVKL